MSANNKTFFTIFLLFLGLLRLNSIPGLEATRKLASVPGLYIFGDSLVDTGNNNYLLISISKVNYPQNGVDFPGHIPTGRFSNGKNAADAIAEKFGLPSPPPYLSLRSLSLPLPLLVTKRNSAAVTGVNFASGGAGIFNSSDETFGQSIPLSYQVNHWLSIHEELVNQLGTSAAQSHLSKSIFTVVIGSNDIFDYFESPELKQQNNPRQYTQLMANKLKEQLKRIHEAGARKFIIFGVSQVGCTPRMRNLNSKIHECNEVANKMASLYNRALVKMLQQLKQELQNSLSYTYFDNFKSIQDVISNPARYGLADVASACCGDGKLNAELPCFPLSKLCPDRTKYLFWDRYGHPTEAAARTTVDLLFTASQYTSPLSLTQLVSL